MLRRGGLLLLERLLVRRAPFRRGVTERDLGVIDLFGLDGERERELAEAGLLERVRSRPRETGREGMIIIGEEQIETERLYESVG